ncbi:MAG: methyl-accepting chemotaxis protein [Gammaproteobacteria bacterium]|nr:methyl-accepting chemotaxis protein [Gammaproteobacteria bacterium]MBU1555157.1 methyl-accepting chemotaxis protein [Gammaproteobacteria bacterium]MBU2070249.1 methyl-accepting chemotaxis protein [Gammaproteobacteria bacterium]MBU2183952.1 methyl-accepting chemotaxis protein [Gammaproteobacteria bacterium]MBU2206756.1 methyl-accepting chemotaxis protein [Gammaproteobacteria bacterium]
MGFISKVRLISLLIVLLPLVVATVVITYMARHELEQHAQAQLLAVREIKQRQITQMLQDFNGGLSAVAAVVAGATDVQQLDSLYPVLQQLNQQLGFYDIFVIDNNGTVVFTVAREADYATNLQHGPYRDSGLGRLYHRLKSGTADTLMQDFSPYAPSNNDAAAFLAKPVQLAQQQVYVAVQLSIEKINQVMQIREGMGQTGETYLVGADNRMRSDSYLDATNRTVQASFAGTVARNGVDTVASKAALAGQSGIRSIIDYNGNPVLSAFAPLSVFGVQWALLAEIDIAEVMAPAYRMGNIGIGIALIAILLALLAAKLVSNFVLRPLGGEPDTMCQLTSRIASGDLTLDMQVDNNAGHLMSWLARMQNRLRQLISQLIGVGQQLEQAAEQNSAAITQADGSIQLQARETDQLATAIEQMSYAAAEIGQNTIAAATEVNASQKLGQQLTERLHVSSQSLERSMVSFNAIEQQVQGLAQDSKRIGSVLAVINSIAEQTNLLALNAAIEAARAGEHGRGFAVVADEVRQLATKVQEAIQDISAVLSGIGRQSDALVQHSSVCSSEAAQSVADAGAMQQAVQDIQQRLSKLSALMSQTASAAEEQTQVSATLAQGIASLSAAAEENSTAISQVAQSTHHLLGLANQLSTSAAQFRV